MRSLQAEAEAGAYWRKLRQELSGCKTAGMLSGGGMHPDLEEVFGRDDFRRRDSS